MATTIVSPADVINAVLPRIGRKDLIGHLYDGSEVANLAIGLYGQTRDELQREGQWGFTRRDVQLTAIKQAPDDGYLGTWTTDYPPIPYAFEYLYPSDCLKVRALKYVPMFGASFDPQPVLVTEYNDQSLNPPAKTIVSMIGPSIVMTYTGQVTDPVQWESTFVEALLASLGRRLAPALANLEAAKLEAADEQNATGIASMTQG